jgi:peroxiredoxin Q/BCP
LVIYFYPKDFSRGWTLEARSYRDSYEEILNYEAVLIGVSSGSVDEQREFRRKNGLMFNLLSDTHGDLGKLFGIRRRWFFWLPSVKRATFVFDKEGVCQGAFSHEFNVTKHVQDTLGVLKKLAN